MREQDFMTEAAKIIRQHAPPGLEVREQLIVGGYAIIAGTFNEYGAPTKIRCHVQSIGPYWYGFNFFADFYGEDGTCAQEILTRHRNSKPLKRVEVLAKKFLSSN
jgi:hypothetical protein